MKVGIIIPCYNEEKRIDAEAFIKFINSKKEYHLCFVNDGSTDNTLSVLNRIKSEMMTKVSIVDMKKNMGKTYAIRAGARYLFNRQSVDYIGYMDADSFSDLNDFEDIVNNIENSDDSPIVFSPISGAGGSKKGFLEKLMSKMVVQIIYGSSITDKVVRLFKRKCAPIVFRKEFENKSSFDIEMMLRLKESFNTPIAKNHNFRFES